MRLFDGINVFLKRSRPVGGGFAIAHEQSTVWEGIGSWRNNIILGRLPAFEKAPSGKNTLAACRRPNRLMRYTCVGPDGFEGIRNTYLIPSRETAYFFLIFFYRRIRHTRQLFPDRTYRNRFSALLTRQRRRVTSHGHCIVRIVLYGLPFLIIFGLPITY